MIKGLVSIYMPTKNRVALLDRAVSSVLSQTYTNLQLIVVDDGSTDETSDRLRELCCQDSRISYFRNENSQGAPKSRNLAIEHAQGEWITGLDDDDWFAASRVTSFVGYWHLLEAEGSPFSGIYSQDFYVSATSIESSRKRGAIQWDDLFEYNSVGNQIFTRTEWLREIGMFDPDMPAWQDLDVFIRLLKRFGEARLFDAPLYHLSIDERPDRISNSGRSRIESAFDRLQSKHPEVDNEFLQMLYLQVFGKFYGHRPDITSTLKFGSYGFSFKNWRRFLKILLTP